MVTRRAFIRSLLYGGLLALGGGGGLEARRLEVVRAKVAVNSLPGAGAGLKVGVMADFHAGAFGNATVIGESFSRLAAEQPDIILLLGDYIDGAFSHRKDNMKAGNYVFEYIRQMQAPLGLFAVLGNHDHWSDAGAVRRSLKQAGAKVLDNSWQRIDDRLCVAGVDDFWEGPAFFEKAMAGIDRDESVLLLSHNPDINQQIGAAEKRVKLVLSGHTHGGQARLPFSGRAPWVPCLPRYRGTAGLLAETAFRSTFLSKGIGTFLLPVRLNCPPDIAVLTLYKA